MSVPYAHLGPVHFLLPNQTVWNSLSDHLWIQLLTLGNLRGTYRRIRWILEALVH